MQKPRATAGSLGADADPRTTTVGSGEDSPMAAPYTERSGEGQTEGGVGGAKQRNTAKPIWAWRSSPKQRETHTPR